MTTLLAPSRNTFRLDKWAPYCLSRKVMALIGYVRCSTDRQTVMQQIDALRAAGCTRIYRDRAVRATSKERPGLAAVRQVLRPGDEFVVTSIDRAFRSVIDAISFLDDVMEDDITFRSLSQHIDTRTPEGRKWYIDVANMAEFERAVISRRTREYMAAAKRRGRKFGRPRRLTAAKLRQAKALLRRGRTKTDAARLVGVSPRTLSRALS